MVDSEGYDLDGLIQKRKNKKAAIRFLKRLLDFHSIDVGQYKNTA
jgi:putative transposase